MPARTGTTSTASTTVDSLTDSPVLVSPEHYQLQPLESDPEYRSRGASVPVMATSRDDDDADMDMREEDVRVDVGLGTRAFEENTKSPRRLLLNLGISFFLFGLINNVLYVIILSAALDLVPPSTPKGIIAFCNITPALIAKIGWPYVLKGRIRYTKRILGCCLLSALGMVVVALFDSLYMRLLGISIASFSSGLGELTFLQLSTTYHPGSVAGHSVGYFASGTGAAGLVGAFMWWELRSLGVRVGVGISTILPFITPAAYYFLLPHRDAFHENDFPSELSDDEEEAIGASAGAYAAIATSEDADPDTEDPRGDTAVGSGKTPVELSLADKWILVKPMLLRYMLPLFCVYTFEYTINQGIAPTLVYPVPAQHPIFGSIIKSIRDYYPLWQLVYQTTVFLSRSSISLGLPALPARLLALPAVVQAFILATLAIESAIGIFPASAAGEGWSILMVFLLISVEGICGGLAYVNVFFRVNQERPSSVDAQADPERARQEKEFKIGSIGFADSSGILAASLFAVPVEVGLCRVQVGRGKTLCRDL